MDDNVQSQWRVTLLSYFNILSRHKPETIQRSAAHILGRCKGYATEVLAIWYKDYRTTSAKKQLCFLYVANEVMMQEKKTGSTLFHERFCKVLGPCLYRYSQNKDADIERVERMMENTWKRFSLFSKEQLNTFQRCFKGDDEHVKKIVDSNNDTFDAVFHGVKSIPDSQVDNIKKESGTGANASDDIEHEDEDDYENKTLVEAENLLKTGWEGISTFDVIRNIIEQCQDNVNDVDVILNNSQLEIIRSINASEEADIRDDFISSKVSKHSDSMDKIVNNHERDAQSKGDSVEENLDETGESYYTIKISEERVELDLDEFEKNLDDHQARIQEAGKRREKLMDSLADLLSNETAALETSQEGQKIKTETLESFKKISRLLNSAVRKRKRQKEAEEKAAQNEKQNREKTAEDILSSIHQSLSDKPKNAAQPTMHDYQPQPPTQNYYSNYNAGYQNQQAYQATQYQYQQQIPPNVPRSIVPLPQNQFGATSPSTYQYSTYYQQQGQYGNNSTNQYNPNSNQHQGNTNEQGYYQQPNNRSGRR